MDPVWRRPGAVGRAQQPVQHQAASLHQHRLPDGRVVRSRGQLAGELQGVALSDGRFRRRGAPPDGRHSGDSARRRDHAGAPVRRYPRKRMGRALARHGDRTAQGGRLLLLSRFSRARLRLFGRHQQGRVGKLRPERPAGLRGRGRLRIRAFVGGVQHQQRAVAAQAARRRHRQNPESSTTPC